MPGFGDPCPDDDEVPQSDNEDDADSCEDDADWDDENDLENDVSFETQTHSQQTHDVQSRYGPIYSLIQTPVGTTNHLLGSYDSFTYTWCSSDQLLRPKL